MVKNKYVLKTVLLLLIAVLFLFVIAQNIDSALQVCSGTDTSCGNNELDCQDCTSLSGCSSGYQITYECFVDFDDQNCGILGDSCTSSCCGAIGGSCIGGVCEIDAGTCSGSVSCFDGYSTGCCQGACGPIGCYCEDQGDAFGCETATRWCSGTVDCDAYTVIKLDVMMLVVLGPLLLQILAQIMMVIINILKAILQDIKTEYLILIGIIVQVKMSRNISVTGSIHGQGQGFAQVEKVV